MEGGARRGGPGGALSLQEEKLRAFSEAARRMNGEGLRWCAGASFMLDRLGILPGFNDVDLVVAREDFGRADAILASLGERQPPKPPDSRVASERFSEFSLGGIEADLFCGFTVRCGGFAYRYVFDEASLAGGTFLHGARIPLAAPEDWLVLYLLMPGRREKARAVSRWLRAEGIGRPELLERAKGQPLPDAVARRIDSLLARARRP